MYRLSATDVSEGRIASIIFYIGLRISSFMLRKKKYRHCIPERDADRNMWTGDEFTLEWRTLRCEDLHDLHYETDSIKAIQSRGMIVGTCSSHE